MSRTVLYNNNSIGSFFTLGANGKYPIVLKRIWNTLADAQEYVNDINDSAVAGITLSVINDTDDKNGVYLVKSIKTTAGGADGVLEKVASAIKIADDDEGYLTFDENGLALKGIKKIELVTSSSLNDLNDRLLELQDQADATDEKLRVADDDEGYLTIGNDGIAVKGIDEIKTVTAVALNDLNNRVDEASDNIESIQEQMPTKLSQLENDTHFITAAEIGGGSGGSAPVSITNGTSETNKYISALSVTDNTITVTKTALPTVSVSGGEASDGKYISSISSTGHSITVTKADLPNPHSLEFSGGLFASGSSANIISVKTADDDEGYLTVSSDGVSVKGIDDIKTVTAAALNDLNSRLNTNTVIMQQMQVQIPTRTSQLVNDSDFVTSSEAGGGGSATVIAGNGLIKDDTTISIKIADDDEGYLTVDENGISLKGIDAVKTATSASLNQLNTDITNVKSKLKVAADDEGYLSVTTSGLAVKGIDEIAEVVAAALDDLNERVAMLELAVLNGGTY